MGVLLVFLASITHFMRTKRLSLQMNLVLDQIRFLLLFRVFALCLLANARVLERS